MQIANTVGFFSLVKIVQDHPGPFQYCNSGTHVWKIIKIKIEMNELSVSPFLLLLYVAQTNN